MKNLLWYLIAGTRGGETRGEIISAILKKPRNTHQLAKNLNYDYKTIQHHLQILVENRILIVLKKNSYGAVYFPSEEFEQNLEIFNKIWNQFGK